MRFAAIEFLFSHVVYALYVSAAVVVVHLRAAADGPRWVDQPPLTSRARLEPMTRIELVTSSLPRTRSAN
jgi:hypothetical protein